jgi:hypothetical protein
MRLIELGSMLGRNRDDLSKKISLLLCLEEGIAAERWNDGTSAVSPSLPAEVPTSPKARSQSPLSNDSKIRPPRHPNKSQSSLSSVTINQSSGNSSRESPQSGTPASHLSNRQFKRLFIEKVWSSEEFNHRLSKVDSNEMPAQVNFRDEQVSNERDFQQAMISWLSDIESICHVHHVLFAKKRKRQSPESTSQNVN